MKLTGLQAFDFALVSVAVIVTMKGGVVGEGNVDPLGNCWADLCTIVGSTGRP